MSPWWRSKPFSFECLHCPNCTQLELKTKLWEWHQFAAAVVLLILERNPDRDLPFDRQLVEIRCRLCKSRSAWRMEWMCTTKIFFVRRSGLFGSKFRVGSLLVFVAVFHIFYVFFLLICDFGSFSSARNRLKSGLSVTEWQGEKSR